MKEMLNFTVGPVQAGEEVLAIGSQQVPYFRTSEFSEVMLENASLIQEFAHAPQGSRSVFLTASGTGAMEAAILNTLTPSDHALVVNGGSFGQRFAELLALHGIPHAEIRPVPGRQLTDEMLAPYDGQGYTAFLVNIHETSTGVLYDLPRISAFCRRNHLFLIVDAISSFLADPFDMAAAGVDVMIASSQKALACPPGISMLILSPCALDRIKGILCSCLYFDLKDALKNMDRGQTPFTPAVGTLLQIHARLKELKRIGGAEVAIQETSHLARYFRNGLQGLPFEFFAETPSNAVTALHPTSISAHELFLHLKGHYGIWVCPNGGNFKDTLFRVGHIGHLTTQDYDCLLQAFRDMQEKHLL